MLAVQAAGFHFPQLALEAHLGQASTPPDLQGPTVKE